MSQSFKAALINRARLLLCVLCSDDATTERLSAVLNEERNQGDSQENQSLAVSLCDDEQASSIDESVGEGVAEVQTNQIAEIGRELSERINRSLMDARVKTEDAVIAVCDQVARLVEIARLGNSEAQGTLRAIVGGPVSMSQEREEASISQVIQTQAESVNRFVDQTRLFFHQQIESANAAVASCREMQHSVAQVVKLVFSSEILAYNIQIESARLGDQGRAFSVLGDEMVRFSSQVRDSNVAIQNSLDQVNKTMLGFQQESLNMDSRLEDFAETLHKRMSDVEHRTVSLTDSLHVALDGITGRNREIIECSQTALSELQFQDPLAQNLMRTELDVNRLRMLIETGSCHEADNDTFSPIIGLGEMHDREPGIVELFEQ